MIQKVSVWLEAFQLSQCSQNSPEARCFLVGCHRLGAQIHFTESLIHLEFLKILKILRDSWPSKWRIGAIGDGAVVVVQPPTGVWFFATSGCGMPERLRVVNVSLFPNLFYRFNVIPIKTPAKHFVHINPLTITLNVATQKIQNSLCSRWPLFLKLLLHSLSPTFSY